MMNHILNTVAAYRTFGRRLVLCVPICICSVTEVLASDAGGAVWTDYMGSQDRKAVWAGFIRGAGRRMTGLALLGRSGKSPTEQSLREMAQSIAKQTARTDVLIPVNGIGSGRRQDRVNQYLGLIKQDKGATWKKLVRGQAEYVARASGAAKIYWQIGNEINSKHYSRSLRTWAGKEVPGARRNSSNSKTAENEIGEGRRSRTGVDRPKRQRQHPPGGKRNDPFIIPIYAEYVLAPTVEAIDAASRDVFGTPGRINIVLGTLANARSERAQDWLRRMLNYTVSGDFAPTLRGKKLYQLIDIIAIHYLVSYPGDEWIKTLTNLKQWIGKGRIDGIWSTEEIGRRRALGGRGAAAALRVASRLLDWWHTNRLTPNQGRVNYWGWNLGPSGTQVNDALNVLYTFFGPVRLNPKHPIEANPVAELEYYGFESLEGKRIAVILFPRNRNSQGTVTHVTIPDVLPTGRYNAMFHLFSSQGHKEMHIDAIKRGGNLNLQLPGPIELGLDAAVLITVEAIR